MENLKELERLLQQNLHGIKITKAAKKLGVNRSTVYKYLYSLDLQGKAHYERGIAYPGEHSTQVKASKNWIPYLLITILLFSIGIIFPIAFIDPSLKLLNNTIINPIRSVPISYAIFLLLFLSGWYAFKEKRKSNINKALE